MANLKNCPLCGGKAIQAVGEISPRYFEAVVRCGHCGCELRHRVSLGRWVKEPEREAKRWIATMWNRRADK